MKIKYLIFGIVTFALLISLGFYVINSEKALDPTTKGVNDESVTASSSSYTKLSGVYQVRDINGKKVLLPTISQKDRMSISNKSEKNQKRVDGNPVVIHKGEMKKLKTQSTKVDFNYGQLYFLKTIINGQKVLLPDPNMQNPELVPYKNYSKYIFSNNGSNVYLVNGENVSKLTNDHVDSYNKKLLEEKSVANGQYLNWASNPKFNGFGDKVAYSSNRRSIKDSTTNFPDIWVIDLNTNSERLLVQNGVPVTWKGNILFFRKNKQIKKIDLKTGQISTVVPSIELVDVIGKVVVYSDVNDSNYYFYNLETEEKYVLKNSDPKTRIPFEFKLNKKESKILATIYKDRQNAQSRRFLIINMNKNNSKTLDIPVDNPNLVKLEGWIDGTRFATTISNKKGENEKTIILNSNGSREDGEKHSR